MDLILINVTAPSSDIEIEELSQLVEAGQEQDISYISKGALVAEGGAEQIITAITADQLELKVDGIAYNKADSLSIMNAMIAGEIPSTTANSPHNTDHENNGTDEIDVSGLSGKLADNQKSLLTSADVTGVLPVTKGGTGSSSKDFVDLSTSQTIAVEKTFSTLPKSTNDAVVGNDITRLSQVQSLVSGVSGKWADPVQDIAGIKAVAVIDREDKQQRLIEDEGSNYRYDAQSSSAESLPLIIVPTDNPATGRWIKNSSASQDHSSLQNLQGGGIGDYQHLTSTESGQLPSATEKPALAGTNGSPSGANLYVTDSDPRNSDDRNPTSHAGQHSNGGSDEISVENLGTASNDTDHVFGPDGAGGVVSKSGRMTIAVGAVAPAQIDGRTLWMNTNVNELYSYDSIRSKWLSISTIKYSLGEDSTDGSFLAGPGITSAGTYTGYILPRNCVVLGLCLRARGGQANKTFELMKDGVAVGGNGTVSLASREYISMSKDIPFSAGDKLSVRSTTAGNISRDVIADIYVKWS